MEILSFLVITATIIAGVFVASFVWAAKSGQWEDLETPAYRILLEDQPKDRNGEQK